MPKEEFKLLYTGSSIVVIGLIELLSLENIIPIIKDEGESARLAGFGSTNLFTQQIYVHTDEIEKAKKILAPLF
ncbi:MAG: DUF2007 domain-containing protein [Flavobacteriaceae bacterium]|nr:DUF2007 domain-containing protein [Flavobacteriaceae bacterium]